MIIGDTLFSKYKSTSGLILNERKYPVQNTVLKLFWSRKGF